MCGVTLEYNQITEQIYLGTNQCCQAHFEESLFRVGIRADKSSDRVWEVVSKMRQG